jgi:hypothetical protein
MQSPCGGSNLLQRLARLFLPKPRISWHENVVEILRRVAETDVWILHDFSPARI